MTNASEKDMYPSVQINLRVRYPASEGWIIYPQDTRGKQTYRPDFVVERKIKTIIQKVPVEVKCTCKAKQEDVDQLNRYSKSLAGPNVSIVNKILVYPSGADTAIIPNDIEKMILKGFTCNK
jgi:hypothetical protein